MNKNSEEGRTPQTVKIPYLPENGPRKLSLVPAGQVIISYIQPKLPTLAGHLTQSVLALLRENSKSFA